MGTDYDRWLERPYQDRFAEADLYERYCEEYPDSDEYQDALEAYLKENPTHTEDDFLASDDYEKAQDAYAEWQIDKH